MSNSEKIALHQTCLSLLNEKITTLKRNIKDAQQAASEDTKSSAGDRKLDKNAWMLGRKAAKGFKIRDAVTSNLKTKLLTN